MRPLSPPTSGARPATVVTAGGLAVVGTVGAAMMAVAHAGLRLPVVSGFGPAGSAAVPPAVGAFTIGAVLYATVAVGLSQRRSWSWPLGLVVNAVTLAGAAMPYRGVGSAAGIALGAAGLILLVTPSARRALLPAS